MYVQVYGLKVFGAIFKVSEIRCIVGFGLKVVGAIFEVSEIRFMFEFMV